MQKSGEAMRDEESKKDLGKFWAGKNWKKDQGDDDLRNGEAESADEEGGNEDVDMNGEGTGEKASMDGEQANRLARHRYQNEELE